MPFAVAPKSSGPAVGAVPRAGRGWARRLGAQILKNQTQQDPDRSRRTQEAEISSKTATDSMESWSLGNAGELGDLTTLKPRRKPCANSFDVGVKNGSDVVLEISCWAVKELAEEDTRTFAISLF